MNNDERAGKFKLSPEVNAKAKEAIQYALARKQPYCVIGVENKQGEIEYRVLPYTGLAVDPKKVSLEFFAGARVEPEILRRRNIIW